MTSFDFQQFCPFASNPSSPNDPLLDSMVASFGVKFPRGMVWYRISIGIGIRIGIDGGSVVVCCMVLQE